MNSVTITEEIAASIWQAINGQLHQFQPALAEITADEALRIAIPKLDVDISNALRGLTVRLNNIRSISLSVCMRALRRLVIAQLGTGSLDEPFFAQRLARLTISSFVPIVLRQSASILKEPQKSFCNQQASQFENWGCEERHCESTGYAMTSAIRDTHNAKNNLHYQCEGLWFPTPRATEQVINLSGVMTSLLFCVRGTLCGIPGAIEAPLSEFPRTEQNFDDADQLLTRFAEAIVQILIAMGTPGSRYLYLTE